MTWTKENNPHNNPALAPKGTAWKKPQAKGKKAESGAVLHKGVKQYGDYRLYGKNPGAHKTQYFVPRTTVGPGDIVDDINPGKLYTFYLLRPSSNQEDAANELDRLRLGGWFKCEVPRFISPTGKFETRDGVLVSGYGIWYAIEWTRWLANRKESRKESGPQKVADAHASLAESARAEGMGSEAQTRSDERGERL